MKTNELTRPALDWAVAKCERVDDYILYESFMTRWGDDEGDTYQYSTDWAQGGPIIEREGMQVKKHASNWIALPANAEFSEEAYQEGDTPLIAAMRCYVASKLGDEVDVPEELLEQA